MVKFIQNNSLSIVLFLLFVVFLTGQALTGLHHENEQLSMHGQPTVDLTAYIMSGPFIEAVFENWESEFLQMAALVILTIWLRQKGSADSKKMSGKEDVDRASRLGMLGGWQTRYKGVGGFIYRNSLSLALIALFLISFGLHALGGVELYNQESLQHAQSTVTMWEYMATSQFWFESFQNWQSEFLSVAVLLVLSVYLRQKGSPESKPVYESNEKTGH